MAGIELINVRKQYLVEDRAVQVLSSISLQVPSSRVTVILGRSGCDRTTLPRLTGGLKKVDQGEVRCGESHRTAFVFQEPRLMPWLTVWSNIKFGLSKKEQDSKKIADVVAAVGLDGFEKTYPSQLSEGMQQGTAIARTLAYKPSFIMVGEPFTALDYFTGGQMQRELMRIQEKRGSSILFVTHSIDEALILGHRIVVIEKGLVKAQYQVPETTGERNLLDDMFISLKRDVIKNL